MKAVIVWKTFEQGGRNAPPSGEGARPYTTVIQFKDSVTASSEAVWSLVVRKERELSSHRWLGDVAYLAQQAPHENLVAGREFELFEGKKCVAEGTLIPPSTPAADL